MADRHPETFTMETNFEGLIRLLAKHLYADPDVFIRELVQNAHDSIVRRQQTEPDLSGRIDIEADRKAATLVFRDNGIGMDREDIKDFLSVIGSTGTGLARRAAENEAHSTALQLIGQFGIGMLSAFVVAEKIVVRTRKAGGRQAFAWHNHGTADCELHEDDKSSVGTEVVVHVSHEYAHLLGPDRIRQAVTRYCDFVRFPISVDGTGPVNAMDAPWHRADWPSERVRQDAYRQYLERRYPGNSLPLTIIPIEIDGECRARGALYIADRHIPDVDKAGVVDIVVRRMFVRADDADLLPPWAMFVHGLVDSPDLVPTAARDNVQRSNAGYEYLRRRLGALIVEHLRRLSRDEPNVFAQINIWHHYHLKGMALYHDDFFAEVGDLLLFETNRGRLSLHDYLTKNAPRPETDGKAPIYYFAAQGAGTQFNRLAEATGWCVINAGGEFDAELLEKYAQRHTGRVWLQRLDATDDAAIFQRLNSDEEERFRSLEFDMEGVLRRFGVTTIAVRMRRFAPVELPAVIILTPASEAALKLRDLLYRGWAASDMADVAREALGQVDQRPIYLQLNATNALVQELARMPRDEPLVQDLMYAVFTSSVLYSRNLLTQDYAENIHRQFLSLCQSVIGQRHELVRLQESLERERREMLELRERQAELATKRPDHVLLFMITPFADEYRPVEAAVRRVFEGPPYFFEVQLGRDFTHATRLFDNVRVHMARAHGFVAETSDLNPNVMLELGAMMFSGDRPVFSLRRHGAISDVPADLNGELFLQYDTPDDLEESLRKGLEVDGQPIHKGIEALLRLPRKKFLSRTLLEQLAFRLTDKQIADVKRVCPTVEDLLAAEPGRLAEQTGLQHYAITAIRGQLSDLAAQ
jgi:molecular chaperone HtpG